jgi:hypothetical protein
MKQEHSSSAAHYRSLLAEQEASGLSLRAFAASRGLSQWTLYGWRSRLARSKSRRSAARAQRPGGFVAVDIVGSRETTDSSTRFEVVLADGCRVIAPRDLALERLADLVRALRAC